MVASVVVADQHVVTGETGLLEAANDLPEGVGRQLEVVMQLGTLPAGLLAAAGTFVPTRGGGLRSTMAVLLAVVVAWRLDDLLKAILDRPRPPGLVDDLAVRADDTGFGFPSGHTTMAFAIAASVHPCLPRRWQWVPWVLAAITAIGRMYVGVHWPMDLVGGAALGTAIGSAAVLLTSRYRRRPG